MITTGDNPMSLSEWESKRLLGPRLPRPAEMLSRTVEQACAFASEHGVVVAKASGVAHKSDADLVRVGLDVDGVRACWAELAAGGDGTVLVSEMVRGDLELIVGALRDPQFGILVSLGLGGVAAEVLRDAVFLLAPIEAVLELPPTARVERVALAGEGPRALAAFAEARGIELIVVPIKGRTPCERMIVKNAAIPLLEAAPCSVLVVPPVPAQERPRWAHGLVVAREPSHGSPR